jgi:hypothetical protein
LNAVKKNVIPIPVFSPTREREFFTYNAIFLGLAAQTTETVRVEISGDADFELTRICAVPFVTSSPVLYTPWFIPELPVSILDESTARPLDDGNLDLSNIWGRAGTPIILKRPHPIRARTVLSVTVENPYANAINFLGIAFHGSKVYFK